MLELNTNTYNELLNCLKNKDFYINKFKDYKKAVKDYYSFNNTSYYTISHNDIFNDILDFFEVKYENILSKSSNIIEKQNFYNFKKMNIKDIENIQLYYVKFKYLTQLNFYKELKNNNFKINNDFIKEFILFFIENCNVIHTNVKYISSIELFIEEMIMYNIQSIYYSIKNKLIYITETSININSLKDNNYLDLFNESIIKNELNKRFILSDITNVPNVATITNIHKLYVDERNRISYILFDDGDFQYKSKLNSAQMKNIKEHVRKYKIKHIVS